MSGIYHDPDWPRASGWICGEHLPNPLGTVAIVGAPSRLGSISPGRCDLAPEAVRRALARYSTYDVEHGRELRELRVRDFGDLNTADLTPEEAFAVTREAVREALGEAGAAVVLGGDNSITRPGCHAIAEIGRCGLLTLDAHLDLRGLGRGLSNGNPVRALLADGLPGRQIVQIGIQAFANSGVYAGVARDADIMVVTADQARGRGLERTVSESLEHLAARVDAIYVDVDLDVLDRAFAPAAPGSRPGGCMPWELRRAVRLCGLHPKVRAMDLVEIDPERDLQDATSLAAAACLLAFVSGFHERVARGS